MGTLTVGDIGNLNDVEVIREFCHGQIDQTRIEGLFVEARKEAEDRLRMDGRLSMQNQSRLVDRLQELQRLWVQRLLELFAQEVESYLTIEDMRAMLVFTAEHPDLHKRMYEFGIKFGCMFADEFIALQTSISEAIDEVEHDIQVQYSA